MSPDALTFLIIGVAAVVTVAAYIVAYAMDQAITQAERAAGPDVVRFTTGPGTVRYSFPDRPTGGSR
ncbi:hypothetical protein ACIBJC_15110 [Streptomyces sp. NPDC050509]|uniref:hypothetical protein n=1 Tax=Streptomyces sp. NPDC050509 TaxID=3365620 RepID=UPI0037A532F6